MKKENASRIIHYDLIERDYKKVCDTIIETGPSAKLAEGKQIISKYRHICWRLRLYGYVSLMAQFMCSTYICFAMRDRRFAITALSN